MKVALYTLGCKLNQAESQSLANAFAHAGFKVVHPREEPDIYVVNTCTVTHIADRKSRHVLRSVRQKNPHALVVATGCYAQRDPQELIQLADIVVGNEEKEQLVSLIQGLVQGRKQLGNEEKHRFTPFASDGRVRSLIKIQDGCYGACTYCIVPKVRPREYSLPVSQIIETIKQSVALGYKEVVLTGTKVGSYKDSAVGLTELVQYILDNTGVERLRLSSLQPGDLSPQLLRLWQDERLCRHFHLALQSGSQSVLQRMMRGYSLDEYCRAIDLIREAVAGAAITTDIMVGFPGESEHEFEESYSFCERAGFANIHVFPFSPRPGTIAAGMPSQIDEKVKKTRSQRMLQLAQRSRRLYCDKFLGQTLPVLWERETKLGSNVYSGLTTNYIRVYARSKTALTNKVIPAKLTAFHGQEMWGEIVI